MISDDNPINEINNLSLKKHVFVFVCVCVWGGGDVLEMHSRRLWSSALLPLLLLGTAAALVVAVRVSHCMTYYTGDFP